MIQYKCPSCNGEIVFDSDIQKMKCPYCDAELDVESLKEYDEELNRESGNKQSGEAAGGMEWDKFSGAEWNGSEEGAVSYTCVSCGGEIIGDKTTAAASCPYCGNPVIMQEQFAGKLRPDIVIPFKLDIDDAKRAYSSYIKGKRLLPKNFRDNNRIKEIKGVYVPFWLYDCEAKARFKYRASRLHVWNDRNYTYTEVSHFLLVREGSADFKCVPADGSVKLPDNLMQAIEPYDYNEAVDFQTAYLSGFLAQRFDASSEECSGSVNQRIRSSTENLINATITGYSSVVKEDAQISLNNKHIRYALLPVWLLNTKYAGRMYTFAMNGQTGRFVGDLPMDRKAFAKWFLGIMAGSAAAVMLLLCLLL